MFRLNRLLGLLPALLEAASASTLFVSHYSGTVNVLTLSGSGSAYTLALTKSLTLGGQPTWMSWNSTTRVLYVSDESGGGSASVWSVAVDANNGLTQTGKSSALVGAVANCQYGDGKFLAMAHYDQSAVSTYKLPLGSSALATMKFTMSQRGPNSRQNAPHPHQVIVDPTGQYLLAPDLGADLIRIWKIDSSTGALTACTNFVETPGTGPRHGTFYGSNLFYVANELANTVHAFSVSYPASGCLTLTKNQVLTTLPNNKTAPTGTKVAEVHTKDNFLYAANRRDLSFSPNDSIAQFTLSSTGSMSFNNITSSGGTYPRTFSINAAGDMVVIGDQTTANVVVVKRDPTTGALGPQLASLRVGSTGTPENDDGLSDVLWNE